MSSNLGVRNTKRCVGDTQYWQSARESIGLLRCRNKQGLEECKLLLIMSTARLEGWCLWGEDSG